MELVYHLGLWLEKDPTLRGLGYQAWAVLVCTFLVHLLLWYHIISVIGMITIYISPRWTEKLKSTYAQYFWRIGGGFLALNNVRISITGDKISAQSALLMCNHQSLADYFIMAQLARKCPGKITPEINFFTWYSVWRLPNVKTWLNMMLCDENWELSKSLCGPAFRRVLASPAPQWIVLFPEVNIWTPAAAYSQRIQAKKYYLPYYDHTLYPRYPGLSNAVCTLVGAKKNIKFAQAYNVTIVYHGKRPPNLMQIFGCAEKLSVTIHVKALPLNSIPQKRAKLEKWLERTWSEKDKQLAIMKQESSDDLGNQKKEGPLLIWDVPISKLSQVIRPASRG